MTQRTPDPLIGPAGDAPAVLADSRHFYRVFGLVVRSTFVLPELDAVEVGPSSAVDVSITLGSVPAPGDSVDHMGILLHSGADGLVIEMAGVARFRVSDGREIVVQPHGQIAAETIRTYLLGTAIGALLHQRGLLPLHANAIEIDGRAFAIAGDSGAGKSTLAFRFQDLGHRLLTDDICATTVDDHGQGWAWPGIPRVKVWRDALDELGHSPDGLRTLAIEPGKFHSQLRAISGPGPYPLAAIYTLGESSERRPAGIHRLEGLDAINAITANSYRRRLAEVDGRGGPYLERVLCLARTTPVFAFDRTWGFESFREEADQLIAHMMALGRRVES